MTQGVVSKEICNQNTVYVNYRNDPKFSDRQVLANSVDPNQTRGAVW